MKVYAISLWQPWGDWILQGLKTIETRTWKTDYRGPLLIHASKKVDPAFSSYRNNLTRGAVIGICTLVNCRPMEPTDEKAARCSWEPGRYAWELANVKALAPWKIRGHQRLFGVELPEPLFTVCGNIIDIEKYLVKKESENEAVV